MRTLLKVLTPLLFLAFAPAAFAQSDKGTIDIQGVGIVTAAPDMAYVTSGVVSESKTAREALSANTSAMSELLGVLTAAGIEDRDIQTSGFSVQPQYVYPHKTNSSGYADPPKIAGYRVTNNVSIRVRDLAILGSVLDQAVSVGANTISGISFGLDDTSTLLTEARKQAMADAIEKAGTYAKAADVDLGRILNISENGGFSPQPNVRMARMDMAAESAPVPVQAGELSYTINVSVRWELEQ